MKLILSILMMATLSASAYTWKKGTTAEDDDWIKYYNKGVADPSNTVKELDELIPTIDNDKIPAISALVFFAFGQEHKAGVYTGLPFSYLEKYKSHLSESLFYKMASDLGTYTPLYSDKAATYAQSYLDSGNYEDPTTANFASVMANSGNYSLLEQLLGKIKNKSGKRYNTDLAILKIKQSPESGAEWVIANINDLNIQEVYNKVELDKLKNPITFINSILIKTKLDESNADFLAKIKTQKELLQ